MPLGKKRMQRNEVVCPGAELEEEEGEHVPPSPSVPLAVQAAAGARRGSGEAQGRCAESA